MSNEEMLATLMTINMALVEIMEIKNEHIKGLKIANSNWASALLLFFYF